MAKVKETKKQPQEKSRSLESLKDKIIEEAVKITNNEVSSCYDLVVLTKEFITIRDIQASIAAKKGAGNKDESKNQGNKEDGKKTDENKESTEENIIEENRDDNIDLNGEPDLENL